MSPDQIDELETDLLLEAIYRRYGYDFRSYSRGAIENCIQNYLQRSDRSRISDLISDVIHNRTVFSALAQEFSVPVSTMFRNPSVFNHLRTEIFPWLRTHPHFRIWHAGCATGEEVYSLAILLKEAGLYDRATIFATDFNDSALRAAALGVFDISRAREYTINYQSAGGCSSFSDYYSSRGESIVMRRELQKRITFANHNLTVDEVFSEVHLVLCRNVLIYFNQDLQARALRLFGDSLVSGGHLCLGESESIMNIDKNKVFRPVSLSERIYVKTFQSALLRTNRNEL